MKFDFHEIVNRPALGTLLIGMYIGTITSRINVTPPPKKKGVRLSEKLQHSVMKFDRSNKFDFCYYGQVNSLKIKIYCSFEMGK